MYKKNDFPITLYLGYLGLTPFVLSLISVIYIPQIKDAAQQAFIVYSVIIISFMSGIHWGLALISNVKKFEKFIISIVVPVLVWITFLLLQDDIFIIFLGCMHLVILRVDGIIFIDFDIKPNYLTMRLRLTTIVAALHFLLAFTLS